MTTRTKTQQQNAGNDEECQEHPTRIQILNTRLDETKGYCFVGSTELGIDTVFFFSPPPGERTYIDNDFCKVLIAYENFSYNAGLLPIQLLSILCGHHPQFGYQQIVNDYEDQPIPPNVKQIELQKLLDNYTLNAIVAEDLIYPINLKTVETHFKTFSTHKWKMFYSSDIKDQEKIISITTNHHYISIPITMWC